MKIVYDIASFLWTYVIAYALLGMGLYYTIRLGVPQIRYFKRTIIAMKNNIKSNDNVSGFATLCAAVGGQVGTGSLVGVASALTAGGPGAIFWMWVTALLGMVITFAEAVLGQLFREKQEDGTYKGGPAYYIEKGLKSKFFAIIISILYILGIGIAIVSLQTNSIANSFSMIVNIDPLIPGVAVLILTALVIVGGVRRLADTSSLIVPFMALGYIIIVLCIVVSNIGMLPSMFKLIFESAFTTQAATSGFLGHTVMQAFSSGVARGLFSNDAGDGVAAIMHATADVKHPAEQGMLSMLGTFITTCIICSFTAFAILSTNVLPTGYEGINLLQEAFYTSMGVSGRWIVFLAMFLFGFTTLLADIYYGEVNIVYIFKKKSNAPVWIYRILTAIILLISCKIELKAIWATIDTLIALIVFINLVALLLLFKHVKYVFEDYKKQLKDGIKEPIWNNTDIKF
ncbi:sodium:alanine symporter family protein [Fusobacterium animalis]|uniref:alanine/glycine:cation symporter family protein n=1 Tax=Fusobacterium animalis TaxID=76859 RepID=UPI0030D1F46D